MNIIKKITPMLAIVPTAKAASAGVTPPPVVPLPSVTMDPQAAALALFNYALWFVGLIALGFLVWGGVQFVMSGGDDGKVGKARSTILYSIVGIIIVLISIGIINWLKSFVTTIH
jgi:hypothetical protein